MADKLTGKAFVLLMERGGLMIPACCGREMSISISSDSIEITKAPKSDWRNYLYGIKGYTLSFSHLIIIDNSFTINDFYDAINNRKTLAFVAQSDEEHDLFFSGNVLITSMDVSGSYKDAMTYTVSALGSGPLNNANPYEINIVTDGEGNPIEDGEGNMIYEQESGDLLPIDLTINC